MEVMFLKSGDFLLTSIGSGGLMNSWWLGLGIFCWIHDSLFSFHFLIVVKSLLSLLILNICTKFMVIISFITLWRSRNGTTWRLLWNTQVIHKFRAEYHLKAFILIVIFCRRISRRYLRRLRWSTKAFSK